MRNNPFANSINRTRFNLYAEAQKTRNSIFKPEEISSLGKFYETSSADYQLKVDELRDEFKDSFEAFDSAKQIATSNVSSRDFIKRNIQSLDTQIQEFAQRNPNLNFWERVIEIKRLRELKKGEEEKLGLISLFFDDTGKRKFVSLEDTSKEIAGVSKTLAKKINLIPLGKRLDYDDWAKTAEDYKSKYETEVNLLVDKNAAAKLEFNKQREEKLKTLQSSYTYRGASYVEKPL